MTEVLLANLDRILNQDDRGIPLSRLSVVATKLADCFRKHGDHEDLYELLQCAVDSHFNNENQSSPRYWFHSTTVERFADIAMATFQKNGLITGKRDWCDCWWDPGLI
jgi:hypothetical protein